MASYEPYAPFPLPSPSLRRGVNVNGLGIGGMGLGLGIGVPQQHAHPHGHRSRWTPSMVSSASDVCSHSLPSLALPPFLRSLFQSKIRSAVPQAASIPPPAPPSSSGGTRKGRKRSASQTGSGNGQPAAPQKRARIAGEEDGVAEPTDAAEGNRFPRLPKYASPNHALAHYGLTAPPSPTLSDSDLPSSTLTAPFEALATAAATAAEAEEVASAECSPTDARDRRERRKGKEGGTKEGGGSRTRRTGRRRVPPPPNAFPDVVQKGMVAEAEARELFEFYMAYCHAFIPLLDPTYDTYAEFKGRTQFCFDAVLSVAARVKYTQGTTSLEVLRATSEEAHGIARSTLFAATVRIEAVQAVTILAAWSDKGYLASGLASRMALEMGLNRALEKLEDGSKERTEAEGRDLVVSARTWLSVYYLDYVMSVGNGRPVLLSPTHIPTRAFLSSPYATKTDIKLVADIELLSHKSRIGESIASFGGAVDERTLGFVRRARGDLEGWFASWDGELSKHFADDSFERLSLKFNLHQAIIYLCCTALQGRGTSIDSPHPIEVRELALEARLSALQSLHILLHTPYRSFLKYGTHNTFVESAFSALFLLKMSKLFPDGTDVDLAREVREVDLLAEELKACPGAQRFAWTLKIATRRWKEEMNLASSSFLINDPSPLPPPTTSQYQAIDWQQHQQQQGQQQGQAAESPTDSLEIYNLLSSILGQDNGATSANGTNSNGIYNPTQMQSLPGWMTQQDTAFDFGDLAFPAMGLDSMFLPSWFGAQWVAGEEEGQAW
ncbi:hypothetical protein BT69DRAFT_1353910 [Atractiella rhizophila]|nr:hypothetical protein BT69DRAFT_1353910 [Atractiella rhizophila]